MPDAIPECLVCLSWQGAAGGVRNGSRNHNANRIFKRLRHFINGNQRCFGIKCVKNRLNKNKVCAASEQCASRLCVGIFELIEAHITKTRILNLGTYRCGSISRPKHPSDNTRLHFSLKPCACCPRQRRRFLIDASDKVSHAVVS